MESTILAFWEKHDIFKKSVSEREGKPRWSFYEGPPTANGKPGTHHIEARVFKDVFPRFQTMKGKQVVRKAGWDCHGLPVEIAVEKELGFSGKADIEKFGVAKFNDKCRESVNSHVDEFVEMTKRMGFWVDFSEAYWTMSPEYVESVWWSLKQIWQKGLLVQDHRVAPYCPRCGTGLSDHELAQGYENRQDPSVYVRMKATSGKLAELNASLLIWTTTPWTLVSNTAVAVNPKVNYQVIEIENTESEKTERLLIAEPLAKVLTEKFTSKVIAQFMGKELERTTYVPPFNLVEIPDSHFVVLADYVTVEDGTGLVHQSPAFGADDLQVCRSYGLPVVNPILGDGTFKPDVKLVGGKFFKDADKNLIKDLKERGVLFKHTQFEHSYPHCWRCHTVLMYYAQPSWYIKTTAIKDKLLKENAGTNWYPATIKTGRYGDWLNNNIDWAISRNRYWGTPLPIWRCANKHEICIESLSELSKLSGGDVTKTDPHRPFVDDITFNCKESGCAEKMSRVPEVIDCWFDSGAMPFAQWGYPHKPGSTEAFKAAYPADFICEAIDQTRGWFYTLMAIGTLVFDKSSYENVLCLGHILDKDGRKMSKHLGNVLEPMPLMEQHGADAVRWFMLAAGSPWSARRVGHDAISDVVRKSLLTFWNTVSFYSLYANAANFVLPQNLTLDPSKIGLMDKWILSELNTLIKTVDQSLENFDSQAAGNAIGQFIDDLSNWYVRRSRRRFWDGEATALTTLYICLKNLSLMMAPMVPFISEHVWQVLVRVNEPSVAESIHLANFPTSNEKLIDQKLSQQVALSRGIVELGRAARAQSAVKVRQPLSRALISATGWSQLPELLQKDIAEELNILQIADISESPADLVTVAIKANFRDLGARYGADVQAIAKAIAQSDAAKLVAQVRKNKSAEVSYESEGKNKSAQISESDLVITETPTEGWAVASHAGESVALDLKLDSKLINMGILREVIRTIQEERKNSGFDVSDRINVQWQAPAEVAAAIESGLAEIKSETLAIEIKPAKVVGGTDNELGLLLKLEKVN